MKFWNTLAPSLLLSMSVVAQPTADPGLVPVAAQTAPGKEWTNYPTRTLANFPALETNAIDQYGGWLGHAERATGYFHTARIDGRWWLVDPAGALYINKAVADVTPMNGPGALAAFQARFGSTSNWVANTSRLLHGAGFNGLGAWSAVSPMRTAQTPLPYTCIWDFMSNYGKKRGGTYQQPGHIGYPHDCIFVFDPQFEAFCDQFARQLARTKEDPWLLGHFSDNEMPFTHRAIFNYLKLPALDPGHQAALAWLQSRHGPAATSNDITAQDQADFLALATERYFRIVSTAIKKYDPHHLYLGTRFCGPELHYPEVFQAAGPYVDVMSINYYNTWTPSQKTLADWSRDSGRPVMITEWYVKSADSGLPNLTGAGWVVKSQHDRGLFYQNYTLALLESKVCVGWHWFKYGDNDPAEPGTDPSNRDANKGILNSRYEPYGGLFELMGPLNDRVYSLAACFDRR